LVEKSSNSVAAIHQFHASVGYGDAVTNYMITLQKIFQEEGFKSDLFSISPPRRFFHAFRDWKKIKISENDILIIHHSCGNVDLENILKLKCRKFALFQNITPLKYFVGTPQYEIVKLGFDQIKVLGKSVETWLSTSEVNSAVLRQYGQNKIKRIPMVVPFVDQVKASTSKPIKDNKKTILFVGRVVPNKCQEELILTLRHYLNNFPSENVQLVIVGNKSVYQQYSQYCNYLITNLGLKNHIKMLGTVSESELRSWYNKADIFLCLSEHEGFGVPLVEAMVHQVPIVAYAEPGVKETLRDAGVLVDHKSPDLIVRWIRHLMHHKGDRAHLLKSQKKRIQDFSYSNCKQWVNSQLIQRYK
jgi:glycosyltransferase involved in cell wall biosynthesis